MMAFFQLCLIVVFAFVYLRGLYLMGYWRGRMDQLHGTGTISKPLWKEFFGL